MVRAFAVLLAGVGALHAASLERQARVILSDNCFECHGPDAEAREADLRLDTFEGATGELGGGVRAVVPGQPDRSELMRRVRTDDPDDLMPPPKAHPRLGAAEIETLAKWIAAGAKVERHWAFQPPLKPAPPTGRAKHPVDRFVDARLESEGLIANGPADPSAQLRRLYLDLIGLPPTPAEAEAFADDPSEARWAGIVERLLASPRYGERWARRWLDLARYADTNGYEKDRPRSIWPYRDWVVRAINDDMPYDRFSIEQLAGDMLPDATLSQRVATGFHRNTMLNEEGGIDPLEYRFYAMADRVATTGTIWFGLTLGCAQCHSHKYDPVSQREYYQIFALLNNTDEPDLAIADEAFVARLAAHEAETERLENELLEKIDAAAYETWRARAVSNAVAWRVLRPAAATSNLPRLEIQADGSVFASGDFTKRDEYMLRFDLKASDLPVTALRLEALPDPRLPAGGPGRAYYEGRQGDFFLSEVTGVYEGRSLKFGEAAASFGKISIGSGSADASNVLDGDGSTGWATAGREGEAHCLVLRLSEPIRDAGALEVTLLFERHFVAGLGRFRISATAADPMPRAHGWTAEDEASLASGAGDHRRLFLRRAGAAAALRKPLEQHLARRPKATTTLVMQEWPEGMVRPTHRYHRGEYLNPREIVTPAVPGLFPPIDGPTNRLGFARWLVSERNPLAARVAVNRDWQAFFGTGLVKTLEDFGEQGDAPSHPELLDWLAVTLVEDGWSRKALHRRIVTSAAYRRSAAATPELTAVDPDNRWLARGPRFRVEAEMVRDIMLAATGVLSTKMGGPGVRPPQPASVTAMAYGRTPWKASTGEDRYRRSLYTFAKRTAPFAATVTFDGPSGETCQARRDRSNTPLQALTLLNDGMFVEMAQHVAAKAAADVAAGNASAEETARDFHQRFLTRKPEPEELAALMDFRRRQLARLEAGELRANEICGGKEASAEQAAWTLVARALMNLDEAITK